jgi:uncharacterized protein YndB with AHSA1/START domain
MASFTFTREIAAPAETVFDVLTDHRGYSSITPVRKSELEREGDPAPNGVGAIRKLTAVGPPLREEVVAYQAPTRFSYTLISGAPVRDHLGTVELTADGDRTKMVYVVRSQPTVPLAGPIVLAVIKQAVKSLVEGIVKESERRAAAAG